MKLLINHTDAVRVKDIVYKLVSAAGNTILVEKPDLDRDLVDKIIKVVKSVMADTLDVLLLGATSTVVEFDIESAVGQAFENVAKLIKWEKEEVEMGIDAEEAAV